MKQVNSELTTMGLATSWIEIFNYREFHIGDSSQTIKGLALHIQSRNTRKNHGNYCCYLHHETLVYALLIF